MTYARCSPNVLGTAILLAAVATLHAADPPAATSRTMAESAPTVNAVPPSRFSLNRNNAMFQDPTDTGAEPSDEAPPVLAAEERWHFGLSPFAWALSLDGAFTVDDLPVNVDLSFSDIWDDLEFAAFLRVRARKERLFLEASGFFAKLGTDGSASSSGEIERDIGITLGDRRDIVFRDRGRRRDRRRPPRPRDFSIPVSIPGSVEVDVDLDIDLVIAELFAGYQVALIPLGGDLHNPITQQPAAVSITPYGGVRYTYLELDAKVDVTATVGPLTVSDSFHFDGDDGWFDPVVGLELTFVNVGRWQFALRGDAGGFGIGDASDLVWSVAGRVGYQFNPRFAAWAGYNVLDYDYSSEGGKFAMDARFEGPVIGFGWVF